MEEEEAAQTDNTDLWKGIKTPVCLEQPWNNTYYGQTLQSLHTMSRSALILWLYKYTSLKCTQCE